MQRKVLHSNCYWISLGPIGLELLLLFLLLLLKGSIFLQSLMDKTRLLMIVQA